MFFPGFFVALKKHRLFVVSLPAIPPLPLLSFWR
jgi:hypothetical protein